MSDEPFPRDAENAPPPEGGADDATLGGYVLFHHRPPAFQGSDGHPYTVSPETEKTPDLTSPILGYLVFPRWATTGVGIVGHLETRILCRGRSREEVEGRLGALNLLEVKDLLEEAIRLEKRET